MVLLPTSYMFHLNMLLCSITLTISDHYILVCVEIIENQVLNKYNVHHFCHYNFGCAAFFKVLVKHFCRLVHSNL